MCRRAKANADLSARSSSREGRMEAIPLEDEWVDVAISNGVINLSFQKRKVIRELVRVSAITIHSSSPAGCPSRTGVTTSLAANPSPRRPPAAGRGVARRARRRPVPS
jgi:hypothetical protein